MRPVLLVLAAAMACSEPHAPLLVGGAGEGAPAERADGGLKWDAEADVRFTGDALEITKRDDFAWHDVVLEVNGVYGNGVLQEGWVLSVERMDARTTYTAACTLFRSPQGERWDPAREPPRRLILHAKNRARGIPGGCEFSWPAPVR